MSYDRDQLYDEPEVNEIYESIKFGYQIVALAVSTCRSYMALSHKCADCCRMAITGLIISHPTKQASEAESHDVKLFDKSGFCPPRFRRVK